MSTALITDPKQQRRLRAKWRAYSDAVIEWGEDEDDARSGLTIGDELNMAATWLAYSRTRLAYLAELVAAGILSPTETAPDDDQLWEINPIYSPREDFYP